MGLARQVIAQLKGDLAGVEVEMVGRRPRRAGRADEARRIVQNLLINAAHSARLLPTPRVRVHVYEARSAPSFR